MLRAEEQARNTYTSITQQAMTWVPLLNIVLSDGRLVAGDLHARAGTSCSGSGGCRADDR